MLTESEQRAAALERLSALMDGELDDAVVAQACTHWRDNADSRAGWHAYHLIGDVLRSDDLAIDPSRDVAFLQAFSARLAAEPVVLAPQRAAPITLPAAAQIVNATRSRRWSWAAPSAIAAGFAVVAGVLVLTRAPGTAPESAAGVPIAQTTPSMPAVGQGVAAVPASTDLRPQADPQQTFVASGQLIRDARLDRYLAAHKQFAGSSALGVPSAFLRNATAEATGR